MRLRREIRSSFYTVYSQPNISDFSSSRNSSETLSPTPIFPAHALKVCLRHMLVL